MEKDSKTKVSKSRILHLGKPKTSAQAVEEEMKKDPEGALILKMGEKMRKDAAEGT